MGGIRIQTYIQAYTVFAYHKSLTEHETRTARTVRTELFHSDLHFYAETAGIRMEIKVIINIIY